MPDIMLVGEAYGEEEERYGKPFIGKAGQQLDALLADAGIVRNECFVTNVFNLRPRGNNLESLCGSLRDPDVIPGLPALARGKYLRTEYSSELTRLREEMETLKPNVVILLGNTACWAVLGTGAISKIRGAACLSRVPPGLKCIPTYHPAAVLRQYDLRHVTVMDLMKAQRESASPILQRTPRELWLDPTLEDIESFITLYMESATYVAVDVETANCQITCVGFAPSPERAIIIPLLDYRLPGGHYWPTAEAEVRAWKLIKRAATLPKARYVLQNGNYDAQYFWKTLGIPLRVDEDTMLIHHALQPESPKSLGFLGSIYTNEIAWKPNRPKSKHNEKPGDEE